MSLFVNKHKKISYFTYRVLSSLFETCDLLDLEDSDKLVNLRIHLFERAKSQRTGSDADKIRSQPWVKKNKRHLKYS